MRKSNIFVRQKTYTAVLFLLNSILSGKKYPDQVIGELFKQEELSFDEKAVIVELVYGILRNLGRIDYTIGHASRVKKSSLGPDILNSIRICTYQAIFTEASAAGIIKNSVAMSSHNAKLSGFVKRTVESVLRNKDSVIFPDAQKDQIENISVYHSHPRWIVEKWLTELGSFEEVKELCKANNFEPPLTLRVNLLKADVKSLQTALEEESYSSTKTTMSPFGLIVEKKEDIFKTGAFKKGLFEIQDEGSQIVTLLTGVRPGELVIDPCAGNGGKSLFLSGLMKNRGTVIAFDLSPRKLANLRRRAAKASAFNIKTTFMEALKDYDDLADCVFIDAPCSGMGVFRRNPDSKWRLTQDDIKELAAKQKEILFKYSRLVKPGGRLVYATCTISREENEDNVRDFLNRSENFYLVPPSEFQPLLSGKLTAEDGFFRLLPHKSGTDGFFAAVMIKNGNRQY